MEKDNLNVLFESLEGEFDVEAPNPGHQERFLSKINSIDSKLIETSSKRFNIWKPLLAVAAMFVLCFSIITIINIQPDLNDLASVSPEMAKTQDFFTSTIENELNNLNKKRSEVTKVLIDDALNQLKILENDYQLLKADLAESGDDDRVIYAMVSNFQSRIEVLQNVMDRISEVKHLRKTAL